MFVRVSTLQGDPAMIDDATTYLREKIVPAARQLEGNRGVLSLVDRASGKGIHLTFWETEEAMRSSEEAANQMREDAASALEEDIVGVDRYEVVIDERM
jgi:heme-degrading monooxygenase HmoA